MDAKEDHEAMARPKKAPEDRRTEQISLRVSPVEAAALQERADRAGMNVTAFARAAALNKKLTAAPSSSVDFETRQELRRIGVNLNQIAKALNARREGIPASLEQACRDLDAIFDQWLPHDRSRNQRP
ncbi:MAG: plasmid mobilization relaxosome protein MobC [Parvularcula sp.]|nr:plasmid mobilization relaxosome protein MobC [Parvularcula sp.]